jgi:hypothetical protein
METSSDMGSPQSLKAQVNSLFRGGDPRPRSERYDGPSKLGVKVSGGSAASEEYRARFELMRCERAEGCSRGFGHRGPCVSVGQ